LDEALRENVFLAGRELLSPMYEIEADAGRNFPKEASV
jgi:hypothetical protein